MAKIVIEIDSIINPNIKSNIDAIKSSVDLAILSVNTLSTSLEAIGKKTFSRLLDSVKETNKVYEDNAIAIAKVELAQTKATTALINASTARAKLAAEEFKAEGQMIRLIALEEKQAAAIEKKNAKLLKEQELLEKTASSNLYTTGGGGGIDRSNGVTLSDKNKSVVPLVPREQFAEISGFLKQQDELRRKELFTETQITNEYKKQGDIFSKSLLLRQQLSSNQAEKDLINSKLSSQTRRVNSNADTLKGLGLNLGGDGKTGTALSLEASILKANLEKLPPVIDKTTSSLLSMHNLFIAFAAIRIADKITEIVDAFTLMENRLKLVSTSTANANELQKELFKIANTSRVQVAELTQSFVRYDYALKGLGATQAESLRFTKTLTEQLAISGLTTNEQSSSLLQLSQALNKGKLDGDEFRTVMETLPTLATAIAKQMGVARGELIKLAPEGKITAKVIREAMASIATSTDEAFSKLTPTIGQSLTVVANKVIELTGHFNKITGASSVFAESILFLGDHLKEIAIGITAIASAIIVNYIPAMIKAATSTSAFILSINPLLLIPVAVTALSLSIVSYSDKVLVASDNQRVFNDTLEATKKTAPKIFNTLLGFIDPVGSGFREINKEAEQSSVIFEALGDIVSDAFKPETYAGIGQMASRLAALTAATATGHLVEFINAEDDATESRKKAIIELEEEIRLANLSRIADIQEAEGKKILAASYNLLDKKKTGRFDTKEDREDKVDSIKNNYNSQIVDLELYLRAEDLLISKHVKEITKLEEGREKAIEKLKVEENENNIERLKNNLKEEIRQRDKHSHLIYDLEVQKNEKIAQTKNPEQFKILKEEESIEETIKRKVLKDTEEYTITIKALNNLIKAEIIDQNQYNEELAKTSLGMQKIKIEADLIRKPRKEDFALRRIESSEKTDSDINFIKTHRDLYKTEADQIKAINDVREAGVQREELIYQEQEANEIGHTTRQKQIRDESDADAEKNLKKIADREEKALQDVKKFGNSEQQKLAKNPRAKLDAEKLKESQGFEEIKKKTDLADPLKQNKELQDELFKAKKESEQRLHDLDREAAEKRLDLAANTFGALAGLAQQFAQAGGKAGHIAFEAYKAFSLAEATVSLASAISKANASAAFPYNIPAITIAAATGAAQISAIVSANIGGSGKQSAPKAEVKAPQKFATGGLVDGFGTTTSDANLIRVSNKEYIVDAENTSKNLPLLRRISNGERPEIPAYQGSGSSNTSNSNKMVINHNVYNTAGVSVETRTNQKDNGDTDINVFVKKISEQLASDYSQGKGPLTSVIKNNIARKF